MSKDLSKLAGQVVVVTRPKNQAGPMIAELEKLCAAVVHFPTIDVVAYHDNNAEGRNAARARLSQDGYDAIVVASPNALRFLVAELMRASEPSANFTDGLVFANGPATAHAAQKAGARNVLLPDRFSAEGLTHSIRAHFGSSLQGKHFLLPCALGGQTLVREMLEAEGAQADAVVLYQARPTSTTASTEPLSDATWLTFTSPSAVIGFAQSGAALGHLTRVAVIGPTTAAKAKALNIRVDVIADPHSIPGLVNGIVAAEKGGVN